MEDMVANYLASPLVLIWEPVHHTSVVYKKLVKTRPSGADRIRQASAESFGGNLG